MFARIAALAFGAAMTVAVTLPSRAEAVNIQEVRSPGGITAWLVEDYTVPIVTMNFAFRGGSSQDGDDKAGLANLMSGLLDEGSGELDSKAFQTKLEDLNIDMSFDAARDAFYGNLRTLVTNLDSALDLTRLAVTEPRFDDEAVARIRGQVLSNLRRGETDPNEIASRAFMKTLYGDHPYGRPSEGTIQTVAALTADDLRAFHDRVIAQDNLLVVAVGAIDRARLAAALDHVFGALPAKADLKPVPEVTARSGEVTHATLPVPQTVIRIGGPGIKRDDPDFIPAFVANHIIGGGTFSSRLYKEVREKRGLSYSVGTSLIAFDHSGAWVAAAATRADAAQTALDIMTSKVRRFAEEGPTEAELAEAKDFLVGNYALRFDASQKIARQLLGIRLDRLGIDYVQKRNDLIRAVTAEDVRRAARRVFGGEPSVVTVGIAQS
ncbi:M16 family metallopeptidase [Propylenella binzhouense]|uniref:Insulinase family protein n=1 Tax=Propylenella binzhouense TaxID=2555902 RepID=A0A964WS23_9HYPH|nr:pitrilysin family protein [Propylenella binzhouense]MYZ46518.1 insulinase family protein [Propylenella binzhouense]